MAFPTGAVIRDPERLNHFYRDLAGVFADAFSMKRENAPKSYIMDLHQQVSIEGPYLTDQGWYAVPLPGPFPRGTGVTDASVGEFTYTLHPYEYATPRLPVNRRDERDSNAPKSLRALMQETADYLVNYPELTFPEMLAGSASTFLDPNVSFTTFVGSTGVFNNAHSYQGQTHDNIVSKTISNLSDMIDGWYDAIQVLDDAVSSNGRPYWDATKTQNVRYSVVIPTELRQIMNALVYSEMPLQGGNTSSTNYFKAVFGEKAEFHVNADLTDANDHYIFRVGDEGSMLKPFVFGEKEGIRVETWENGTSDWAKENQAEGMRYIRDMAFGAGNFFCAVKID